MCNGEIDRLLGKVFFVKWVQILESMCNKQFEVDKETPGFIVECLFAKQACRMSSKKALFATRKEKLNDGVARIPICCLVFRFKVIN